MIKVLKPRLKPMGQRLQSMSPQQMATDRNRGKTAARGYGGRWQRERAHYLDQHPLCVMCQAQGMVTLATVVDHIIPHKGDPHLMWDQSNWQALCKPHHDSDKQRADRAIR